MREKHKNSEIIVVLEHPHGNVEIALDEWILKGPGERDVLRPIAARCKKTGKPLPLHTIPLRYRNNSLSRVLIAMGFLSKPWGEKQNPSV